MAFVTSVSSWTQWSRRWLAPLVVAVLAAGSVGAAQSKSRVEPDPTLNDAELAVAQRVHVGVLPCELGQSVRLDHDPKAPGYFRLQLKRSVYRMRPVQSRTGAIRLEDTARGAVWIQLGNKSMLMNQKLGQRMADECASDEQRLVAQALKGSTAPGLLDALPAPFWAR